MKFLLELGVRKDIYLINEDINYYSSGRTDLPYPRPGQLFRVEHPQQGLPGDHGHNAASGGADHRYEFRGGYRL